MGRSTRGESRNLQAEPRQSRGLTGSYARGEVGPLVQTNRMETAIRSTMLYSITYTGTIEAAEKFGKRMYREA